MRTDQWVYCEACQWIVTLFECPDGPTYLVSSDYDGATE